MNASILLHPSPSAGFDAPFEMLLECHQRVERMLQLLERLAVHLDAAGVDADARSAARDLMRYFDQAGPAHHEDEERHVLPALAAHGDASLRALAARLQSEHRAMAQQWQGLRAELAAVAAAAPGAVVGGAAVARRGAAFAALYRAHIDAEERLAYPALRPTLDAAAQARMGGEMARRRGLRGSGEA